MIEDKHIYTSSKWVKFIKDVKTYKNNLRKIQTNLSKPKKLQPPAEVKQTIVTVSESQPTAIAYQTPQSNSKVKMKKPVSLAKPKRSVNEKTSEKLLVYSLVFAIVSIILLGIFLTYVKH